MSSLLAARPMGSFTTTALGLGTARLGAFWQGRGMSEGVAAVSAAVDQGVGLIDTADVYARGLSERLIARALGKRRNVVVMTKVGLLKTPIGLARASRATGRTPGSHGLRRAAEAATCFESDYVRAAARSCAKRLQRSELDVLLLHEPAADDLRAQRFGEAIDTMIAAGDVREWGASVRTAEAAIAAMDLPTLTWLQVPANAAMPDIAEMVSRHPRIDQVTVVALGVLGDGELLDAARCAGRRSAEVVPELVHAAVDLPGVDAALLGMSTAEHVTANLASLAQFELRRSSDRLTDDANENRPA